MEAETVRELFTQHSARQTGILSDVFKTEYR
jgi:hypothetical protein